MWLFWPPYWTFPVISSLTWVGFLLAMLIDWLALGRPQYPSMDDNQHIAYISDVGAFGLKPLFIAGSSVSTLFLVLSFASERWLRHTGRLARNTSVVQKALSATSVIFAIAGASGLILLSIFDVYRHKRMHDGFLLLFIGGFVISAVFLCIEYQRLGSHYPRHRILSVSFWVKLAFIFVELTLAIGFVATDFTGVSNVAAVLEWVVALTFTFYILSFLLDLLPSVQTRHRLPQGWKDRQTELGQPAAVGNGGMHQAPLTTDSAGPNV